MSKIGQRSIDPMAEIAKAQSVQNEYTASPTANNLEVKNITIDTVHNDEALKVLANYDGPQAWDEQEERKLRKKIDRRLLPILCITYALQYYDKGKNCLKKCGIR